MVSSSYIFRRLMKVMSKLRLVTRFLMQHRNQLLDYSRFLWSLEYGAFSLFRCLSMSVCLSLSLSLSRIVNTKDNPNTELDDAENEARCTQFNGSRMESKIQSRCNNGYLSHSHGNETRVTEDPPSFLHIPCPLFLFFFFGSFSLLVFVKQVAKLVAHLVLDYMF